jgi:hypothetical protein
MIRIDFGKVSNDIKIRVRTSDLVDKKLMSNSAKIVLGKRGNLGFLRKGLNIELGKVSKEEQQIIRRKDIGVSPGRFVEIGISRTLREECSTVSLSEVLSGAEIINENMKSLVSLDIDSCEELFKASDESSYQPLIKLLGKFNYKQLFWSEDDIGRKKILSALDNNGRKKLFRSLDKTGQLKLLTLLSKDDYRKLIWSLDNNQHQELFSFLGDLDYRRIFNPLAAVGFHFEEYLQWSNLSSNQFQELFKKFDVEARQELFRILDVRGRKRLFWVLDNIGRKELFWTVVYTSYGYNSCLELFREIGEAGLKTAFESLKSDPNLILSFVKVFNLANPKFYDKVIEPFILGETKET